MYDNKKPYEDLCNAVITQACIDYVEALQKKEEHKIYELEKFFTGQYICQLTDLDGEFIMNELRKGVKNGTIKKLRKENKGRITQRNSNSDKDS